MTTPDALSLAPGTTPRRPTSAKTAPQTPPTSAPRAVSARAGSPPSAAPKATSAGAATTGTMAETGSPERSVGRGSGRRSGRDGGRRSPRVRRVVVGDEHDGAGSGGIARLGDDVVRGAPGEEPLAKPEPAGGDVVAHRPCRERAQRDDRGARTPRMAQRPEAERDREAAERAERPPVGAVCRLRLHARATAALLAQARGDPLGGLALPAGGRAALDPGEVADPRLDLGRARCGRHRRGGRTDGHRAPQPRESCRPGRIRSRLATAGARERAPDRRSRRAGIAVGVQLDPRHPLDPLKAPPAGSYEPQRCAMLV